MLSHTANYFSSGQHCLLGDLNIYWPATRRHSTKGLRVSSRRHVCVCIHSGGCDSFLWHVVIWLQLSLWFNIIPSKENRDGGCLFTINLSPASKHDPPWVVLMTHLHRALQHSPLRAVLGAHLQRAPVA